MIFLRVTGARGRGDDVVVVVGPTEGVADVLRDSEGGADVPRRLMVPTECVSRRGSGTADGTARALNREGRGIDVR